MIWKPTTGYAVFNVDDLERGGIQREDCPASTGYPLMSDDKEALVTALRDLADYLEGTEDWSTLPHVSKEMKARYQLRFTAVDDVLDLFAGQCIAGIQSQQKAPTW